MKTIAEIWVDERRGNDETGNGSATAPVRSWAGVSRLVETAEADKVNEMRWFYESAPPDLSKLPEPPAITRAFLVVNFYQMGPDK